MEEKRGQKFWKLNFALRFLNISLVFVTLLAVLSFYALGRLMIDPQNSLSWRVNLIILQLGFTGVIFSFIIGMFLLLHRTLGAIPRLERTIDKIISGEYSLRLSVRNKDVIKPLIDKINQLIELLEKKSKG